MSSRKVFIPKSLIDHCQEVKTDQIKNINFCGPYGSYKFEIVEDDVYYSRKINNILLILEDTIKDIEQLNEKEKASEELKVIKQAMSILTKGENK